MSKKLANSYLAFWREALHLRNLEALPMTAKDSYDLLKRSYAYEKIAKECYDQRIHISLNLSFVLSY